MTDQPDVETPADSGRGIPRHFNSSRQVNYLAVYEYAQKQAAALGQVFDIAATAGTPSWCSMPDDSAEKKVALLAGAVRDAIANEAKQEAEVQAAQAIRESADWSAACRPRGNAYIPRTHEGGRV